ncbi:MAG TPA: regulatory protein RecX [Steroidobacteraceae bacterium]|nr:regulatory protein RecX [Steroidobacteraceae bacterium]
MRPRKPKAAAAPAPDDPRAARLAALKLLNRRDYGARELAERLVARGFARTDAETAISGLAAEKLVDDARFAEHFVAYHANRGQGPVRIAHRLREAGVAPETIAATLDAGSADWRRRCEQARRKRFGAGAPASWAERGRQARFLSQRGFSAEQIRAAVGGDMAEE